MKHFLCSRDLYCSFLKVTSQRYSALSLSEVSPTKLSHDAISRWLSKVKCQPKDVWEAAKGEVLGKPGVIIADETVLDKSRSDKVELVSFQYSGDEHDVIKGIGVVNLLFKQVASKEVIPVDYRIYFPKDDGKTKNDHFREMVKLACERKVQVEAVIADTWYSSLNNVKFIRDLGLVWVMGLRKNRIVNKGVSLSTLTIPDGGLQVHLRGYGWITVFRFAATNGRTDYIGTNLEDPTREKVERLVKMRWSIEVYHRELKQTCGLEYCQSRVGRAQRNHIGLSILTWIRRAKSRSLTDLSFYQQNWAVIKQAIAQNLKIQFNYCT
jgi:hypothetical protein